LALRYAGLLYGNNCVGDLCKPGIYTSEDVIRLILAGADAVQMVSAIYKNQPSHIAKVLEGINAWMDRKGYQTLNDFKGKLSRKNMKDPFTYQRAQYIDILMKSEEIFKKYPMV
jgi:dihydroorotate dehydrogenase (fumarate)